MPGAELADAVAFSAPGQIVPCGFELLSGIDVRGQHIIKIAISRGDVIQTFQILHCRGREVAAAQEVVMNLLPLEVVRGGGGIELVHQLAVERRGEDFALAVGGKDQVGRSILVVPDVGVVQVDLAHLVRRVEQVDRLEIRTDLENACSGKCEISLIPAWTAIDGKAAVRIHQHLCGLRAEDGPTRT